MVYDIETSWYKGKHPLTYDEYQALITEHKNLLNKCRAETTEAFEVLSTKEEELTSDNIFLPEKLAKVGKFSTEIFETNSQATKALLEVSRCIIQSSVKVLEKCGMVEPCKFVVIGMGSIARGEATPYSDLEYGIITENDEHSEYFLMLAVDSYFRIGNLAETPLKSFDIQELKSADNLRNVKSDAVAIGYRIDGITRKAGNIPTGRIGGNKLTMTVDGFMRLYKSAATSPPAELATDLSHMLSSTVVIYANEEQAFTLHEQFHKARLEYEATAVRHSNIVMEKRLECLKQDIESYVFLPQFIKYQPPRNLKIMVKTDIFRYPTLLAGNLRMCMALSSNNPWDVYKELKHLGFLSEENHIYLKIVLALSIYIRTGSTIALKTQYEAVSLDPFHRQVTKADYYLPYHLFIILGCLLIPIKHSILASVKTLVKPGNSFRYDVGNIMASILVDKTDFMQRVEVRYFSGDYLSALNDLSKAVEINQDKMSCNAVLEAITKRYSTEFSYEIQKKYIELCSYLMYFTHNYVCAAGYFERLIALDKMSATFWKLLLAHCMREMGKYAAASCLIDQVNAVEKYGGFFY